MFVNTPETFLFLLQRSEKAGFHKESHIRRTGLLGAMLLDLTIEGTLSIENGKLTVIKQSGNGNSPYQSLINTISDSEKKRKIKSWISRLSGKGKEYETEFLRNLHNKGYIKIEEKQFLWFKYLKTHLINHSKRSELIDTIRDTILNDKMPDENHRPLYGLINACDLYPVICRDKSERKHFKAKLSERLKNDAISKSVNQVIRETESAILSTIIVSAVVSTTVNSS